MATITKNFSFNTDLESWTSSVGSSTTASRSTTQESTNDTNSGTGSFSLRIYGRAKTNNGNYWLWTGTWADLGVPAGNIITSVNATYDWKCSEYTTGTGTNRTGPFVLLNSSDTTRATFSAAQSSVSGITSSWSTVTGTQYNGITDSISNTVKFKITCDLATGASNSAAVTFNHDWITITVTYEPITFIPKAIFIF